MHLCGGHFILLLIFRMKLGNTQGEVLFVSSLPHMSVTK